MDHGTDSLVVACDILTRMWPQDLIPRDIKMVAYLLTIVIDYSNGDFITIGKIKNQVIEVKKA